ncbi:MAG: DsbA family protein [Candidatus Niyogibacteria bacterium]|nr:DsbA family protein [Candidatus Niyogibacteria bacterium]
MENSTTNESGGGEKQSPFIIPGTILLAAVIVAGAIMYASGGKTAKAPDGEDQQAAAAGASEDAQRLLQAEPGDFVLGNPEAPVTLVEFADFQCPFCGRFFKQTLPQIKDKYVKTGQVKFIFRDFAFLGEESFRAAEAARCAGEQRKFWEYHDYLYNHQSGENEGAFADTNLKKFALTLGLDQESFDACLDSGKYRELVEKESSGGNDLGVSGTPTTFVNGKSVVGAVPFSEIDKEIQAALQAAGE